MPKGKASQHCHHIPSTTGCEDEMKNRKCVLGNGVNECAGHIGGINANEEVAKKIITLYPERRKFSLEIKQEKRRKVHSY